MFARNVSIRLKANSLAEFGKTFDRDVLPILQKQPGFQDEITFSAPGSNDVVAISLWDTKEHAEAYSNTDYPQVLKSLEKFLDGTPKVQAGDVISSTTHKQAVAA
jgi:heme-degrading monooxygenase HmoA